LAYVTKALKKICGKSTKKKLIKMLENIVKSRDSEERGECERKIFS